MRFSREALVIVAVLVVACGGTVAPGGDAPEPGTGPSATLPGLALALPVASPPRCDVTAGRSGASTCEVARRSLVVEPLGVHWMRGTPWGQGAAGTVRVRYRNDSTSDAIAYPALALTASDDRVVGQSGAHRAGDGEFHPDRYALAACDRQEVAHAFTVNADIPAGTTIRFTLTPAVGDGSAISTCGGTLVPVEYGVVVP